MEAQYHRIIPFPFTTLNATIETFKSYFITVMGEGNEKYNKIETKVREAKKVKELIGSTVVRRTLPHTEDLIYIASTLPYTFFKFDLRYTALIALMVLKYWNDNANMYENIASYHEVDRIANNVLIHLSNKLK